MVECRREYIKLAANQRPQGLTSRPPRRPLRAEARASIAGCNPTRVPVCTPTGPPDFQPDGTGGRSDDAERRVPARRLAITLGGASPRRPGGASPRRPGGASPRRSG